MDKDLGGHQGKCPKCGAPIDSYGELMFEENDICYPYTCVTCGFKGYEWLSTKFITHTAQED